MCVNITKAKQRVSANTVIYMCWEVLTLLSHFQFWRTSIIVLFSQFLKILENVADICREQSRNDEYDGEIITTMISGIEVFKIIKYIFLQRSKIIRTLQYYDNCFRHKAAILQLTAWWKAESKNIDVYYITEH